MEIYSSIEYETIILTITKLTVWERKFIDANICTVIHTVEGYVIFAETTGLVSFHDLNWVIAYCFEENEKNIYIPFDGGSIRCGELVHYFTWLIDIRSDSVNEALMVRRYSKHDLFAMTIC